MSYAIIETGGKQYKVEVGDLLYVEKLGIDENSDCRFDKIVAVSTGDALKTGNPYVEGAAVKAKLIKNGKAKKITVFTYRPKKGSKRKQGHRQPYSKVEITEIQA
ncbi:MAG: 50S ribosomal protein L21 [Oscillospiraceae bacterium]|nr:50S ribosomal protein L21 [Oscillospiraceae bacterium]